MLGRAISHYRVVRKLGGGGMGVVYAGEDVRLGRGVALKFLLEGQSSAHSALDRFLQEARAASCLNHPNICIVHDVGEYEDRPFIVMELLEGQTLKHRLQARPLTTDEVLDWGIQAAQGLEYAHSQGVIHRDIKPANLFVTANGQLKILDFGLAKFTAGARSQTAALGLSATLSQGTTESDLTAPGEFVGTVAYMSPEQARGMALDARTDLFSFGVVLYEMATGTRPFQGDTSAVVFEAILNRAPVPPVRLNPRLPEAFEHVVNRALNKDREQRYHSAAEIAADLRRIAGQASSSSIAVTAPTPEPAVGGEVVLLYKRNAHPDEELLGLAEQGLRARGYRVFIDRHLVVGMEWAREIEQRISRADAVVVLLSAASVQSEMLAYEVQIAREAAQRRAGKPLILPVRVKFDEPLPESLAGVLDGIQWARWSGPEDNDALLAEISASLLEVGRSPSPLPPVKLEAVGGAVPLDSSFYIVRPTDEEFYDAITRQDSIVLVKGARQMGKTSLMARGLQEARKADCKVVLTDFQKLNAAHLQSVDKFFLALAEAIADQLDLGIEPDICNPRRGPSMNFERFLRREVLKKLPCRLVWGMDEADRLFTCSFGSEVFGLFRSWHNERSLDPTGPWQNLTLAIAYATEAHLFITDMNQSPFNVGTRLTLSDFTQEQVSELNGRYGSPLKDPRELMQFYELLGGQPYLTRRGLHELASRNLSFRELESHAARDEGPFGDHLRRILVSLAQDQALCDAMRGVLAGRPASNPELFYRLRSSGVVTGESVRLMHPRCRLYEIYLTRHLV